MSGGHSGPEHVPSLDRGSLAGEALWEAGGKGGSPIPGEMHIIRNGTAMDQYPFMQTLIQTRSRNGVAEEDDSLSLPSRS